ncbi:sugar ABC transporter permease, partial [Rhizobium ruizarguesonis]
EQKLGYASAVSVILFVIVLLIALLQRKLLRRFDV